MGACYNAIVQPGLLECSEIGARVPAARLVEFLVELPTVLLAERLGGRTDMRRRNKSQLLFTDSLQALYALLAPVKAFSSSSFFCSCCWLA